MKPEKIFLTGFMGSGKTTLGRMLAARLGREFHDLDEAIEADEGMPVARIFEEQGEPGFRAAEACKLWRLATSPGSAVIACGGGTPCDPANRGVMETTGLVVWLDRPFDEIWRHRDEFPATRPLARVGPHGDGESELRALLARRLQAYALAPLRVPVGDAGLPAALELLVRLLNERGVR